MYLAWRPTQLMSPHCVMMVLKDITAGGKAKQSCLNPSTLYICLPDMVQHAVQVSGEHQAELPA